MRIKIIGGDVHLGLHCPEAVGIFLEAIDRLKPEEVIDSGDLCDFGGISAFAARPSTRIKGETLTSTAGQVYMAREYLKELRSLAGDKARLTLLDGNHCGPRWDKYAGQAKALAPFLPTFDEAIGVGEVNAEFHGSGVPLVRNEGVFEHGQRFGIYAVRHELWDSGRSHFQGHSHRLKMWTQTLKTGELIFSCELGCLCQNFAHYMTGRKQPDWQQGFFILVKPRNTWIPIPVPIVHTGETWEAVALGEDIGDAGARRGRSLFRRLGTELARRSEAAILEDVMGVRSNPEVGSDRKTRS